MEEFGILGLQNNNENQTENTTEESHPIAATKAAQVQKISPTMEFLITQISEDLISLSKQGEIERLVATSGSGKVSIFDELKKKLVVVAANMNSFDDDDERQVFAAIATFAKIINRILQCLKPEASNKDTESGELCSEILLRFLELITERLQVVKTFAKKNAKTNTNINKLSKLKIATADEEIYLDLMSGLLVSANEAIIFQKSLPCLQLQSMLATTREVWIFLKDRCRDCSVIVKKLYDSGVTDFSALTSTTSDSDIIINSKEFRAFLRIKLEIFRDSEFDTDFGKQVLDWIVNIQNLENVVQFLAILVQYSKPEITSQLPYTGNLISSLTGGLLSNSPITRKESLFVLKYFTSLNFPGNDPKSDGILYFNLNNKTVSKFWADFFDLFEILDEKQIHIIKPLLPKLQNVRNIFSISGSNSLSAVNWFFVLLKKMVHHDNRLIASEGLLNYLDAWNFVGTNSENASLKKVFTEFLQETIFPILKENVGWILPDAQDFFNTAKKLGYILTQIFDSNFVLIAEIVMSFINKFDVGLSPSSVHFLILSLNYGMEQIESKKFCHSDVENILAPLTRFMSQGLSALDKFLRSETLKLLANIFCKVLRFSELKVFDFDVPSTLEVLNFLGVLDSAIISKSDTFDNLTEILVDIDSTGLKVQLWKESLSSLQIFGIYRVSFLQGNSEILELEGALDLLKSKESRQTILRAHLDFLQLVMSRTDDKTFSELLISQMRRALHFWKSEENFDSRTQNQSDSFVFPNFKECQLILKLIAEKAVYSDTENELLGILSYASEVLDSKFRSLGVSIQDDFEFLKFSEVLAKCLICHAETGFIQCPAAFTLQNFSDLFGHTDISKYADSKCTSGRNNFGSEFIGGRLSALSLILQLNQKRANNKLNENKSMDVINEEIIKTVLDQLDTGGPQGIINTLEFVAASLSYIHKADSTCKLLDEFVQTSWKSIFELRKTDSFWTGVRQFVNLIVHPFFRGRGILQKYAKEIFDKSDTVTGISLILMEKIVEIASNSSETSGSDEIIQVCLDAIWFGPPLLKHIKVINGLWEYVQCNYQPQIPTKTTTSYLNSNEDGCNFAFNANAKTRLLGIRSIQYFVENSSQENMLRVIMYSLLDRNDFESDKKRRYFGNSSTHRIKQRIAQALLVFQRIFSQEIAEIVTQRLILSLTRDSPQPSVRYLMEWIIIRNLVTFPEIHASFFQIAEECYRKRVGFGSFLSTICWHTCNNLKSEGIMVAFAEKSLRILSALLMGQHFTVRLYARVCFRKIYEKVVTSAIPPLSMLNKFEVLYENVYTDNAQTTGNISKISQNIESDFYVELFDSEAHFLFETVFIYLPKIAGMATDELPQERDIFGIFYSKSFETSSQNGTKLTFDCDGAVKKIYAENEKLAWHLKAISDDGREMGEETAAMAQDLAENNNFQKKLNPWKFLSIAPEISDFSEKLQLRKSAVEDGLIVVASLIDRVPNLGGLCRSCEIFGVSKYVISGLKSMEEQQFQNLSVSAQRWIDILEVPAKDLEPFLASYSQKGYTILGVEQALESVPLNEYKFPKKSVLLLGNEKYGIPSQLLQLVNQCLEIPQVGVVRSLNVHVTGALCIWQYAMQHTV